MNPADLSDLKMDSTVAAQLLEANEKLVLALLRAQTEADTAAGALDALSRSVEFDSLTGLPNRILLADRMARALISAQRRDTCLALMFLDLDDFKQINDTLGHAIGDEVLRQVGRCLTSSVREADTVSRHGGDEFLILLGEVSQPDDAALIAEKLLAALAGPLLVNGHEIRLTASIGISVYPRDGEDIETLTQRADAAMYMAKRNGRGGFNFHGDSSGDKPRANQLATTRVSEALEARHSHLQEANEQLILAVLTAQDLTSAAEQSRQKQTEFLAVLVHELRNPLAPIRTAAALLSRVPSDELPRMQAIIKRQVAHLSRLLDDLLDLSRVDTGKLRLACQNVDLCSVVDTAASACRPAMLRRQQKFSIHMPADPIELHADPVRLTQVFSNLLDNASKYSPVGGTIDLSIANDEAHDAVVITVTDSGIGMAAEALHTVFEPFVQDSHAVGFNGAGLGIGLTVVRELVDAHGGSVFATSAGRGLGSQFVVTLPRHPLPAEEGA